MAIREKKSKATYVARGYGQVEPNHLSAQRNGQIYAQLPAAADIEMLENGQFITYNYAKNENGIGEADFEGKGEWMMVFNEVKLYHDFEDSDADFAMIKSRYKARVYSPIDGTNKFTEWQSRFYGAKDGDGNDNAERVTVPADVNPYAWDYTEDPFKHTFDREGAALMPKDTAMVPRVIKTMIGDIFTTNTIMAEPGSLKVGDTLTPGADGYLAPGTGADALHPTFQVVKVYSMPDEQPGVKLMRIA